MLTTINNPSPKVLENRLSSTDSDKGAAIIGFREQNLASYLNNRHSVNARDFGARGDGVQDDTQALSDWLDEVIGQNAVGILPEGQYLCNYLDKAIPNGIVLSGAGVIKATGVNRLAMMRFTQARGEVLLNGITFDGDNRVARLLEVQNSASTPSTQGDVTITETVRFINARNNAPDTFSASAILVRGGFKRLLFAGEIDGVDSTSTSGASSDGLSTTFFTTSVDDYIKHVIITGTARIKNVKNNNTTLADADGCRIFAPTDKIAYLTVCAGAYFENCKGRAIKSQVVGNTIVDAMIYRDAYDGLSEINLQYAGGTVRGNKVLHDGVSVDSVISVTQRPSPNVTHCNVIENELTVIGIPAQVTNIMVATDVTDASVKLEGVTIRDNRVNGAVNYFTSHRVTNQIDVNRVLIDGNYAKFINQAFIASSLFGAARAQLSVVFTNNACGNVCQGAQITNDLIVEYARNNHNINRLLAQPFTVTIDNGQIDVYGEIHQVNTQGGAGSDDLTTINTSYQWEDGQTLTLKALNDVRTVVLRDGVGNLRLNGDFSLNHSTDRIVLSFDGANWVEVSRSDNAA